MPCDCVTSLLGRYVPFKVRVVITIVGIFCCLINLVPQLSKSNVEQIRIAREQLETHRQQNRPYQGDVSVNLLSAQVVPRGSLSTKGWWMSHVTWDVEQITNRKSKTKKLVIGTKCSIYTIVETYQYITIKDDLPIKYLHFTVSSASWKLRLPYYKKRSRSHDPLYEARLYVVLNDGAIQLLNFEFEPGHTSMQTVPPGKRVTSVMVILACFGYKGYVAFTDVAMTPLIEGEKEFTRYSDFISNCPPVKNDSLTSMSQIAFSTQVVCSAFSTEDRNSITLVTQLTLDRVKKLKMALKNWNGPISVVIYIIVKDNSEHELNEARDEVEEKLNPKIFRKFSTVHVTVLYGNQDDIRYPINYLRNVAVRNVKTKYLFVTDVDFIPSRGLQTIARSRIEAYTRNHRYKDFVGFIVPAFQFNSRIKSNRLPKTRRTVEKLVKQEIMSPFREIDSPLSHSPTDYNRWYTSSDPYEAKDYQDKYEPYLIRLTADFPMFDERFTGYGMNKISNIMELIVLGHKFVVLPDVWIVHCHHRTSALSLEHRKNPDIRFMNRLKRFQFLSELSSKHGLGVCKKTSRHKTGSHRRYMDVGVV